MILQGKWKFIILYELCIKSPIRFGELLKNIEGITNTMLTSSLRELERDGLVSRIQFNEIPPHVEYSLTEKGEALLPVFYEMTKWGSYVPNCQFGRLGFSALYWARLMTSSFCFSA